MKRLSPLLFLVLATVTPLLRAVESETMAERTLKQIVAKQQELLATAAKGGAGFDESAFQTQLQSVVQGYEILLRDNPKFAVGYAAYGVLLGKIDRRKESAVMLLKANEFDPELPLVKNQLGNYLAEEGRPLEAVNYFLSAIKLAPTEPLYHYQLGTLLHEARDDFLRSGDWTREALDRAGHEAFRRAAELAPGRIEFTYRYAESFYDLEKPDWEGALKAWGALEEKAPTDTERQTMRLHAANICLKMGKPEHARALLASVTEPTLAAQKQKLVAQLDAKADK